MSQQRLRQALLGAGVLVALSSVTALALASRRIVAGQATVGAPSAGRCMPSTLNRSAVLPGTSLAVSPLPDSYDASTHSQISLLGAPQGALSAVSVSGSRTGRHAGRLEGYSQGDGASFVPSKPFRAGETVTVRGRVTVGSRTQPFAFHFVIHHGDPLPYTPMSAPSGKDLNEVQHFRSRADLDPPVLVVTAHSPKRPPGYVFAAPYSGPGKNGPMIFDEAGNVVWFDPLPANTAATNLQVQQYAGRPVLTWWQGYIPPQGFGEGEEVIADSTYHQIARVRAGNGYAADLHDFHITPQNTALLTFFDPIACDLSSVGGPRAGAVTDSGVQELDLGTGLVRREWHSLDHVPLSDSYSSPVSTTTQWPFDYFHINSVQPLADDTTLISARNTSALYYLSTATGEVLTRVGGKHSDVKLASGAATAFQHDSEAQPNGTITIFDNGAVPKVHPQSRGIVVSVNAAAKTDTLVAEYEHPTALSAASQGNVQTQADGNMFLGWGSKPYFSEFAANGTLLFDAHWHGSYQSYRAYRFPWTGTGLGAPAIAATAPHAGAPATVYASWNGDTQTTSWRVLAGPSAQQLTPVATATRSGFETAISTHGPVAYRAVQALNSSGATIGTSKAIRAVGG